MHPRLLTTPYFVFHTFGLFLAAAFLAALWQLLRGVRREEMERERAISLGLWIIIGAIIGAKLLMILRSFSDYLSHPADLFSFATIQSAGDFYGGFIGAILAALLFFSKHPEIHRWKFADLCAPAIALGQAVGRIGCFMAGDDYGKYANAPWAVVFSDPDAAQIGGAPLGVPLHPVQLYESLTCLGIFVFLLWLTHRKKFDGEIILAYSILYAVARFIIEYFRGDADRGFLFNGLLSTSQVIAIVIILISIPLICMRYARQLDNG
jgi:phosphatidylglycerol---prolipoprotein diacylglyceryl transferase